MVASLYGLDFVGSSTARRDLVIPDDLMARQAARGPLEVPHPRALGEVLGLLPGCDRSNPGEVIARR